MANQHSKAWRALLFATLAFAANFSVWTLYAAAVIPFTEQLGFSLTQLGVLLASPMLTGALSRIPAGLLVGQFNAKKLFSLQMLLCIPPLVLLPLATDYTNLLLVGLWIGLSGSSFTFGINYINDFFSRKIQGTIMGVFGVGNAGAAINLVFAPIIIELWGWSYLGPVYAVGLVIIAWLFFWLAPNPSEQVQQLTAKTHPRAGTGISNIISTMKNLHVWALGLYYYFVFGSFLALLMWLPYYYMQAYQLNIKQAMAFTLFFVATSSVVRALGGWFADKYGGRTVNWSVFWVCLVCLFFLSYPPTTMTIHGVNQDVHLTVSINVWVFTGLLFIIGVAQGFGRASVFKVIHDQYPNNIGVVGGVVAAIGALGGCSLPILFGLSVDLIGIYSASFMVLYGILALCMMAMYMAIQAETHQKRIAEAKKYNFLEDDNL
ncbi:MFS transporter [Shewanella subflava]|uniref:MFS transporter n=1 Tax=Shewanella subflava TaxID=2986476 RepID=A0ABT3ID13_9GAMM|nr:MFS transporter [Shewanella subflava]MCW3173924.1 MFS transporter [Shewanella subflava]